jgi:predicted nucleic acid-binding protein
MKRVFVDTGGFVALLVAEDEMHPRASALFESASRDRWTFVITNAVVVETYLVLLARAKDGRRTAISFLDAVEEDQSQGGLAVERVRPDDELNAIALLRTHTDKDYSLCDALSFVVMERLGITEAIAFDRHFREYGRFTILR